MTPAPKNDSFKPYVEALKFLPLPDLEATHKLAWRMYEQEAGRADQVEKKGNYVLGFTGLTVSFFSGAAITAAKTSPWWVLLVMLLTLGVLFTAVWHAYHTVRSKTYMVPTEDAVLKIYQGQVPMLREHTLDVLESTRHNRQVTNQCGGHLKVAERLLALGLTLLFASLLASLLNAALTAPATPVPVPEPSKIIPLKG